MIVDWKAEKTEDQRQKTFSWELWYSGTVHGFKG